MRSSRRFGPSRAVVIPAAAGLVAGGCGAIGWRHGVPRQIAFVDPAAPTSGAAIVLVRVNYLAYVSGPPWWPMAVVMPLIGLFLGGVVGVLMLRVRRHLSARQGQLMCVVSGGTVGAATGGCAGVAAHLVQPVMRVVNAAGQRPPDYNDKNHSGLFVYGAPTTVDLDPISVVFPLVGTAAGIVVAAVSLALLRSGRRAAE